MAGHPQLPDAQAAGLYDALVEFGRLYSFRDRDQICCHDVSVTQCHALDVLVRRGRSTLGELAAALYIDKSTASRVVAALERKRYAARVGHPRDGRAVWLAATPAGRRLHARIRADLIAEQQQALAEFPPAVRDAAGELIRRLTRAVQARSGCCVVPEVKQPA